MITTPAPSSAGTLPREREREGERGRERERERERERKREEKEKDSKRERDRERERERDSERDTLPVWWFRKQPPKHAGQGSGGIKHLFLQNFPGEGRPKSQFDGYVNISLMAKLTSLQWLNKHHHNS